jgi:hypothetical protein
MIEADGGRMVIDLGHRPLQAGEVARADLVVDADTIPDAERCEHMTGLDCVQQVAAGVYRGGKCAEVIVELAAGDHVEQRALGIGRRGAVRWTAVVGPRPSRCATARTRGSCCAFLDPEVFGGGVRVVEDEPTEAQTRLRM